MPVARFQLPDGKIARFEVPDGTTPEQAQAMVEKEFPNLMGSAAAPERSLTESVGRQLGLTARAGMAGVTAIPAMVGDALGMDSSGAVQRLADKIGLPRPEGATERVVQDVTGAVAGQGGLGVVGGALKGASGPVASRIGEVLATRPGMQLVGAGGAAGGAATAREGELGVGSQLAAVVAGGLIAPVAADVALQGGKALWRAGVAAVKPFIKSGQEEIVGQTLRSAATDSKRAMANLQDVPELVHGSQPTTAQGSRDPGLLTAERALRSGATGPRFSEQASKANQARNILLNALAGDEATLTAAKADRSRMAGHLYGEALKSADSAIPPSKSDALSISQFVAKEGGLKKALVGRDLNPDYAELPQGLLGKGLNFRRVIHAGQTAKSPDHMLERLKEAGYLGERSSINDMYTLLDDELSQGAKKIMSVNDMDSFAQSKVQMPQKQEAALLELSQRPAFQQAVNRARDIASEEGLSLGRDPAKDIRGLHYVKLALDDIIEKAQGHESGVGRTQLRAIMGTKEKLLAMMDDISPPYQSAREEFAIQSKPINQMEALQEVRGRVLNAGTDAVTGDQIMSSAKFYNVVTKNEAELSKVLTKDQMSGLRNIASDLQRGALSDTAGKAAGSNTYQNLSTAYILGQSLGGKTPQSPLMQNLLRPLNWLNKLNETDLQNLLTDAMLDPGRARSLMAKASPRAVESVAFELAQRARALGIGAGVASGTSGGRRTESEQAMQR